MLDFVIFAENKYPARRVAIDSYRSELMISTDDLESVLINEDGAYRNAVCGDDPEDTLEYA